MTKTAWGLSDNSHADFDHGKVQKKIHFTILLLLLSFSRLIYVNCPFLGLKFNKSHFVVLSHLCQFFAELNNTKQKNGLLGHFYIGNILNEGKFACFFELRTIYKFSDILLTCSLEKWPFLTFLLL